MAQQIIETTSEFVPPYQVPSTTIVSRGGQYDGTATEVGGYPYFYDRGTHSINYYEMISTTFNASTGITQVIRDVRIDRDRTQQYQDGIASLNRDFALFSGGSAVGGGALALGVAAAPSVKTFVYGNASLLVDGIGFGGEFVTGVPLMTPLPLALGAGAGAGAGTAILTRIERVAAERGDDAFSHGFKYADRVRARGVQDPVSHNFPYTFDDAILRTTPIPKANGYNIYRQSGTMGNKQGVFEIGVTKDGVIDHRFFRPDKK